MLRGFTTINYYVDDVAKAAAWYVEFLGIEPYFIRPTPEDPAYIEFRVGDYRDELALISSRYRPEGYVVGRPAGAVMYWHVDDVAATIDRLVALGATPLEPLTERGDQGWVTATVADPFGNVIGLMYSPHYLEILDR
ncbi:MAG TPA: VOC family protein [Candidatus Ruania gallistercoris]|uniref:VOC family protein n=1 Tax=Candidatus Ruania gallistercoris TaxID=2838746 RepID=A0A9D2EB23_9MICO|nr:VOC family protein [Candidatus Ruania gallistercoris]